MELNQTGGRNARPASRLPRARSAAIRIDFTPMVDLGFLLITFFMLTTSLRQNFTMPVAMPIKDGDDVDVVAASKTLTLLLGSGDKVIWWRGLPEGGVDSCGYGADDLRHVIFSAKKEVDDRFGTRPGGDGRPRSRLVVLIKPTESSVYQNLVDVLDEMNITGVSHYAIVDATEGDRAFLHHF